MIMSLYREIDREKVQFDFVENCPERGMYDDEIESLGGRIFHCPRYSGVNHASYVRWWTDFFDVHSGEFSVVHGHLGSTASIYLGVAKKHGIFTIAHSHNAQNGYSLKGTLYAAYSFPTRFIADYFFACSQAAGVSRFGRRIAADKRRYSILPNAIRTEDYAYSPQVRARVRAELGVGDKTVIGHVGRFDLQKNHPFLLQTFCAIRARRSDAVLLLVGDGKDLQKIQAEAHSLEIENSIRFLGVRTDVNELLQAMDVFVFPSLYEGLPVTLVEAQTAGLPCVISDRISEECILTEGLVTVERLESSAEQWAEHILSQIGEDRKSRQAEVAARGYDISETAVWLKEFYLERAKKQCCPADGIHSDL